MNLNFGCGTRLADGWTNIDFDGADPRVKRVNLLRGFPFPAEHFDAVYSSHVIEHFSRPQAEFLISEARRVLKPRGVLRVVVPDLEGSCREYLRILSLPDADPAKRGMYEWTLIELLDQLVRTRPEGAMGPWLRELRTGNNHQLQRYVQSRTQSTGSIHVGDERPASALPTPLSVQRLRGKFLKLYLRFVALLVPISLRDLVLVRTSVGERHQWMYDHYGLRLLLEHCGFSDVVQVSHCTSGIPDLAGTQLDTNADGSPYKRNSLYFEARK